MKKVFQDILVCLFVTTLTGCVTTAEIYPEFSKNKLSIENVSLLVDVVVLEDITGNIDKTDVIINKELGTNFIKKFVSILHDKGYEVNESYLFSGMQTDKQLTYRVIKSAEEKQLESDAIPIDKPPFYIDERLNENKGTLISIFDALNNQPPKQKGQSNKIIRNVALLGNNIHGDTLILISLEARNVPIEKQIGQAVLTSLLTLGTVATWQTSGTKTNLFIINTKNGEVIWESQQFMKGGIIDEQFLQNLATGLVILIPDKFKT